MGELTAQDKQKALDHLQAKAEVAMWNSLRKHDMFTRTITGEMTEAIRWVLEDALDHKRLGLGR